MTRRLLILLLGLCVASASASASASAQEEVDYARTGLYGGMGGVYAHGSDVGSGGGLALRAGYRMMPHIGAEISFEWLGGFDPGFGANSVDTWSLGLSLRGYLLTGRVQPYGLLGAGVAKSDAGGGLPIKIDGTGGELRLGGGVEIYLTEEVVLDLRGAYLFRMDDIDDFDYLSISVGASYRF
jgi:opacity protein-like surface antigen